MACRAVPCGDGGDDLAVDQQEGVREVDAGAEVPDVDLDRGAGLDVDGAVGRPDDAGDGGDGVDPLDHVEEDLGEHVVARGVGVPDGIVRQVAVEAAEEVRQVAEDLVGIGLAPGRAGPRGCGCGR